MSARDVSVGANPGGDGFSRDCRAWGPVPSTDCGFRFAAWVLLGLECMLGQKLITTAGVLFWHHGCYNTTARKDSHWPT